MTSLFTPTVLLYEAPYDVLAPQRVDTVWCHHELNDSYIFCTVSALMPSARRVSTDIHVSLPTFGEYSTDQLHEVEKFLLQRLREKVKTLCHIEIPPIPSHE